MRLNFNSINPILSDVLYNVQNKSRTRFTVQYSTVQYSTVQYTVLGTLLVNALLTTHSTVLS